MEEFAAADLVVSNMDIYPSLQEITKQSKAT